MNENEQPYTPQPSPLWKASKWLSLLMTPALMPLLIFIFIFTCSYMRIMPFGYRLTVVAIVGSFTLLLPALFTLSLRLFDKPTPDEALHRGGMMKFMFICSYIACLLLMARLHMPWYFNALILASLLIQLSCYLIGIWWRICLHMATIGGVIASLVVLGQLLGYNPMWALSALVLLSGMLGTARIIYQGRTNAQVFGGFALGFALAYLSLYPLTGILLQHLLFIY